jgi:hypothetical protein
VKIVGKRIKVNQKDKIKKTKVMMRIQKNLKIKKARNQGTRVKMMRIMTSKMMKMNKKKKMNLHITRSLKRRQNSK